MITGEPTPVRDERVRGKDRVRQGKPSDSVQR